ncbi:hypothetical protein TNCV_2998781 [Trichonephila clavipes]|nr:hypothetical protein TNCV_2998781 [Trichonephila clavipes]
MEVGDSFGTGLPAPSESPPRLNFAQKERVFECVCLMMCGPIRGNLASLLAGLLCSYWSREVSNELEFVTLCQDRRVVGKHANRGLAGSRDIIYVYVE